mmetsp:Transcript_36702/g.103578  ORF Transcript_36702/g.103578 Transcript_36702/m.103578 type:complete len:267 (+) Transcript_36702:174-974(+)
MRLPSVEVSIASGLLGCLLGRSRLCSACCGGLPAGRQLQVLPHASAAGAGKGGARRVAVPGPELLLVPPLLCLLLESGILLLLCLLRGHLAEGVNENRGRLENDFLSWPVLVVCGDLLHGTEHLHSSHDLPKHGVLVVQVVCALVEDEELAAIGTWAAVGHAEDSTARVGEPAVQLVPESVSVDAGPALAGAGGVAALDHETLDATVEHGAIVVALLTQLQEVLAGPGHQVAVELDVEIPQIGVHTDVALLPGIALHEYHHLLVFL